MKIVVLIKQVPDTYGDRKLNDEDGILDRTGPDAVTDEINERALEVALQFKKVHGGEVTVLAMGPAGAIKSLRKCLAMGADHAVHVTDGLLAGSDVVQTSVTIAAALRTLEFDLVLAGNESTDGRSAAVPAMIAELLTLPQLTFLRTVQISDGIVSGERITEDGYLLVQAALPAMVSVTDQVAEPRYPGLKGTLAARKKPLITLTATDLGMPADDVGGTHSWSQIDSVVVRPPRAKGKVITDDGTAVKQIIDFLATAKLVS